MVTQLLTADNLKWLLPIVLGSIVLLIISIGVARGSGGWPAVLIAAFATALVGGNVFRSFSVTKDGVNIATALNVTADITSKLEKAVQDNANAISIVNKRVDSLAEIGKLSNFPNGQNKNTSDTWDQLLKDSSKINEFSKIQQNNINDITGNNKILRNSIQDLRYR